MQPAGPKPRYFGTAAAFRAWLAANAGWASELLFGFRKVGGGRPSLTWPESVDEALCVGCIDDEAYAIRFTARRYTSIWSMVNIAKVAQLQARMTPAGEAAFARRCTAKSRVYTDESPAHAGERLR